MTTSRVRCPDCGDWACATHGGHIGECCDCVPCDDCGDLFPPEELTEEFWLCKDCMARGVDFKPTHQIEGRPETV